MVGAARTLRPMLPCLVAIAARRTMRGLNPVPQRLPSVSSLNDYAPILDGRVISSRAGILVGADSLGRKRAQNITELRVAEPESPRRTVDRAASSIGKVPLRVGTLRVGSAFGYAARSLGCFGQAAYVLASDWRQNVRDGLRRGFVGPY